MDVFLKLGSKSPIVIGCGLITLDIILNQNSGLEPQILTGGTCGNVLTILSYLGWKSYPVARINNDVSSTRLKADLENWNVNTDFLHLPPTVDAPIIVQKIKQNSRGESYHKFSWTCPKCGSWLPQYRPVPAKAIKDIFTKFPRPQVFFFDRLSRSVLIQAEKFASLGAIIFFEPSGAGDVKLFKEALNVAHIVKYAEDRSASFKDLISSSNPLIEIETMGSAGLRYKTQLNHPSRETWNFLPALPTKSIDTAGAGDWCSSGVIHSLGAGGLAELMQITHVDLIKSLKVGQAMASWACQFEGPRGGMYQSTKKDFTHFLETSLNTNRVSNSKIKIHHQSMTRYEATCPVCQ